jgi:DNA modification methylase
VAIDVRTIDSNTFVRTLADGLDLYFGDSMRVMEHLRAASPGGLADFICVDPPYGIDYIAAGHEPIGGDKKVDTSCVALMADLMKPDTAMLLFSSWKVLGEWDAAMEAAGLFQHSMSPLDKVYPPLGELFGLPGAGEILFVGFKGRPPLREWIDNGRFFPAQPSRACNYINDDRVWTVEISRDRNTRRRHPTPKPPLLMERALLNFTNPGDLVVDPFMGGSPVGVAAVRLGRRYIGIENNRARFNLAVENIQREMARQEVVRRARALSAA